MRKEKESFSWSQHWESAVWHTHMHPLNRRSYQAGLFPLRGVLLFSSISDAHTAVVEFIDYFILVSNLQISALQKVVNCCLLVKKRSCKCYRANRKLQRLWHTAPNGGDAMRPALEWGISWWNLSLFQLQGWDMKTNQEKLICSNLDDCKGSWLCAPESWEVTCMISAKK